MKVYSRTYFYTGVSVNGQGMATPVTINYAAVDGVLVRLGEGFSLEGRALKRRGEWRRCERPRMDIHIQGRGTFPNDEMGYHEEWETASFR